MQLPFSMFVPESSWRPTPVSRMPSWSAAKRVCVDIETKDETLRTLGPGVRRKDSYVVGIGFAIEDGPSHYLPIAHDGGDNLPSEEVWSYIRDQIRNFRGEIAGAGFAYDYDWLTEMGVDFSGIKRIRDVQVAEPLLDELQMRYGLDAIAERRGLPGKDETHLRAVADAHGWDPKKHLWRFAARHVGPYVLQDVGLPLQLLRRQERELEEQELWGVYDLESDLLPVLVKMRRRGVPIDQDRLARIEAWALKVEHDELERIRHLTGFNIGVGNCMKKALLKPVLESIGLKVPMIGGKVGPTGKVSKPQPQITAGMLKRARHEVTDALLRAREFNKLRTTFCARTRKFLVNGRVHCTFNQLRTSQDDSSDKDDDDGEEDDEGEGGRFGRLSCKMPNLQQEPIRHEEYGHEWRSIYLPEPGCEWGTFDFSQQEPRVMVHYADLLGLQGAREFSRAYREDPKTDFHEMTARIVGVERKPAKAIGLGCAYGMGEAKLCRQLGLPTMKKMTPRGEREVAGPEGKKLMEAYHAAVPFIRQLSYRCQDRVKAVGFIRTLLGRRCRFPRDEHGNYEWLHKALNRLIQGSGADQTKKAVVELDRRGHLLHLQVHDEVDVSLRSRQEAREIQQVVENVVELRPGSKSDVEIGRSWGEAIEVALAA